MPELPEPWLLGSSPQSAIWAAQLRLPYAFADFINPGGASIAAGYRERCTETAPRTAVAAWVLCAETDEQALENAMTEWPNGGMKFGKADIRSPHDFAQMAKLVRPEDFDGRMVISSDPDVHRAAIQEFADLGFDRIYLHNVGRNQAEWLEVFGREVLPKVTR